MITIEEHKRELEGKGFALSDQETEKLLNAQYQLANIFFEMWVKQTKQPMVISSTIVTRKKDGNCISVDIFSFIYIYA